MLNSNTQYTANHPVQYTSAMATDQAEPATGSKPTRRYLTPAQVVNLAATFGVQVSQQTLANRRVNRRTELPFKKINGRVYYELATVAAWLQMSADELLGGVQ